MHDLTVVLESFLDTEEVFWEVELAVDEETAHEVDSHLLQVIRAQVVPLVHSLFIVVTNIIITKSIPEKVLSIVKMLGTFYNSLNKAMRAVASFDF